MWDRATDAEASVIGAALIDQEAVPVALRLSPEDYTNPILRDIHRAMAQLYESGQRVDLLTVDRKLDEIMTIVGADGKIVKNDAVRQEATEMLIDCGTNCPTSANVAAYVEIVAEKSARRRLHKLGEGLIKSAERENLALNRIHARAQDQLNAMLPRNEKEQTGALSVFMAGMEYARRQCAAEDRENMTGIESLDRATGGLHAGEMTILAARSGVGKSTLAWQIADTFANRGQRVMFVSTEMPHEQLAVRWFAMYGLDAGKIRHGKMTDEDWAALGKLTPVIGELLLETHTMLRTPSEISAKVDEYKRNGGLGLLVVDYLQQLQSGKRTQNANAEVSAISLALKRIALEHKVPVLCLSQLNRAVEGRNSKFPVLSDLRDSGSIEQDADNVLFLMTPKDEKETPAMDRQMFFQAQRDGNRLTYIDIAKQRNGPQGRYALIYRPSAMRMYSLAQGISSAG